jgi:Stage II sporulation protein E (SpoIIE)
MKTTKTFWRTVPLISRVIFLVGVFLIFASLEFVNDIMAMGREPTLRLALAALILGVSAVFYAASGIILRRQFWKIFLPAFVLYLVLVNLLAKWLPDLPRTTQMGAADIAQLQSRLSLDGNVASLAIVLGYACIVYASVAEGRRYFRVHAEMALAADIHRVLVPSIDEKIGDFEFYGRSLPSGEVGGDLIDVFPGDKGWIAYVADVSGHGVAPGVVMGMVKSAARMQLSSEERSAELLERLNSVLYPIKKPEMFVTFAYLAWNGEQLEYSLAGHPPILHYHAASKEISEVSCSNLPLGMFDGQEYVRGTVQAAGNDLFLLLTDGLLEVTNAKDEELGLDGVRAVMSAHAMQPIAAIFQAVLDAANGHGHATDDQSLLLVRYHPGTV